MVMLFLHQKLACAMLKLGIPRLLHRITSKIACLLVWRSSSTRLGSFAWVVGWAGVGGDFEENGDPTKTGLGCLGRKKDTQKHPPKNGFEVVGVNDFIISIVVDLRGTGSKNTLKIWLVNYDQIYPTIQIDWDIVRGLSFFHPEKKLHVSLDEMLLLLSFQTASIFRTQIKAHQFCSKKSSQNTNFALTWYFCLFINFRHWITLFLPKVLPETPCDLPFSDQ